MKKIKELLLPIYIIINILYVLVGSFLVTSKVINNLKFSKGHIIFLVLNVIVLLVLFIIKLIKKKMKFNITDIFIVLMIIFSIISCIYAYHPSVALNGFRGRYEGLFQIFYYYSLYLLSTFIDKKHKKIIVYSLLICGVIQCIYAFLQVFEISNIMIKYDDDKPWATGFITNPNLFGTFMILCLSFSLGLFIDLKKLSTKIINCILIFIFMAGILISNTLSALVGLFIVYLYIIIYIIKNKLYKKFIVLTLILVSTTVLINLTGKSVLIHDLIKTKNQTIDMVEGNIDDNYGTHRIFVWRNALKVVPDNFYTGVGIDNFYYAFGKRPLATKRMYFDKAHNEYLQILVCEGIFALISYLLFFGFIVIKGIRNSYKYKELYLVLPVIGFLVQAFFNISVIEVAPFVYISLGLATQRENKFIE